MIQIIRGVYGHYVTDQEGKTRVVARDKHSDPFELTPEQEARLVRVGAAEYVVDKTVEAKPADTADDLPNLQDGVEAIPEYNAGMKADELRKIAKLMGLTFAVGTTKVEMVAQMDAFLDEHMEDSEDDADMPPEEIEDAPMFDAAEAVQ